MNCCAFFYVGIPTPKEKAEQLIQSLRLAADANPAMRPPATQPPATHPKATKTVTQATTPTTPSSKNNTIEPPTTDSPRQCHGNVSCIRPKRQASTINYCPNPSEQANNRICPDMCDKDRPGRPIGVPCSKCTMHSGTSLYLVVVTGCV